MLNNIKKELLNEPDKIVELLEHFDYANISLKSKYIQCGRDKNGSKKSIVIKLENNPYLCVKDYPKNIYCDLFSYIIKQRECEFIDVLNVVKGILHISDYYDYFNSKTIFGGFYENIRKKNSITVKTYELTILEQYSNSGNLRFLRDNISLETQKYFNIRYDIESQSIVIPIFDQVGSLVGIKARINYDPEDGDSKYFYLVPCLITQTLYGYSQNYRYLTDNTIYIFEAEKSTMQCHSYNIRNCISLGSSTLSAKQCQMILELNPHKVIFMMDEGLEFETIEKNIKLLKTYSRFSDFEIGYWDSTKDQTIPHKSSPSDLGKEKLLQIIDSQIVMYGDE